MLAGCEVELEGAGLVESALAWAHVIGPYQPEDEEVQERRWGEVLCEMGWQSWAMS